MGKIITNYQEPGNSSTYGGETIDGGDQYLIRSSQLKTFQDDAQLATDLQADPPLAGIYSEKRDQFISGKEAVNLLMDEDSSFQTARPFASKVIDGKKVFRRKHGMIKNCPANDSTLFEFIVPYDLAKMNLLEITKGVAGDQVDLKVYDDPSGTISGTPNQLLNQFGFDVAIPDGFYKDESQYDADLIKDMKIEVTYKNNHATDQVENQGVNIVYHELK